MGISAFAQPPKQGILATDTQIPLVVEGKTVGSMTLKAGTSVNIIKVLPDGILISKGDTSPTKVSTDAITASSLAIATATPVPTPTPKPTPIPTPVPDYTGPVITEYEINPDKIGFVVKTTDLSLVLAKAVGDIPAGTTVTNVGLIEHPFSREDYYPNAKDCPTNVSGVPEYKWRTMIVFEHDGINKKLANAEPDCFTVDSLRAVLQAVEADDKLSINQRKYDTEIRLRTPYSGSGPRATNIPVTAILAKDAKIPNSQDIWAAGSRIKLEFQGDKPISESFRALTPEGEDYINEKGEKGWYIPRDHFTKVTLDKIDNEKFISILKDKNDGKIYKLEKIYLNGRNKEYKFGFIIWKKPGAQGIMKHWTPESLEELFRYLKSPTK